MHQWLVLNARARYRTTEVHVPAVLSTSHPCLLPSGHAETCRGGVDPDERVFFANWQMQGGGTLHCHSTDPGERAWAAAYLHELQADIVASRFYDDVKQVPRVGRVRWSELKVLHAVAAGIRRGCWQDAGLTHTHTHRLGLSVCRSLRPPTSRPPWRSPAPWRAWHSACRWVAAHSSQLGATQSLPPASHHLLLALCL